MARLKVTIKTPWLQVMTAVLVYVATFTVIRSAVGDVVGALSTVPVLIAGNALGRKKTWLVAVLMIVVNGVMFAITEQTRPSEEWHGAVLGSAMLLVTADLMGRVRDNAIRLKKSGESKDRFLAGVSHELRTPLTAVVGYASILKSAWPDLRGGEREELLDVLHQQSAEVASIVEDLLVATRLDTDDVAFSVGRVSLAIEIAVVADALTLPPESELTVSLGPDLEVFADGGRVRQILRNLLSNAIRYGGPNVVVEASQYGPTVAVTVRDNGTGLPRHEWESIFDSYYRSHRTQGQPDAVGLGLSVSRRLARRMGGDITYRYLNGESHFVVTLPAVQQGIAEAVDVDDTAAFASSVSGQAQATR